MHLHSLFFIPFAGSIIYPAKINVKKMYVGSARYASSPPAAKVTHIVRYGGDFCLLSPLKVVYAAMTSTGAEAGRRSRNDKVVRVAVHTALYASQRIA